MYKFRTDLYDLRRSKSFKYLFPAFLCSLIVLVFGFVTLNPALGFILALSPLIIVLFIFCLDSPTNTFYVVIIISYFLLGVNRYLYNSDFPIGTVMDIMLLLVLLIVFIHNVFYMSTSYKISDSFNGFTYLSLLWLIYVILEIANPRGMLSAWLTTFRGVALYMFLLALIVPMVIKNFNNLMTLLNIWSVLTIIGALQAIYQKHFGFDAAENYWLFVQGGSITHVIGYGVRYFSFFTDAANFGAQMAMALTVFSIISLYTKNNFIRIWYIIVSLIALYGMMISGTRSALVIPFVGYIIMAFLSRKLTLALLCTISLIGAFVFLKFTYIGHGNALIRRMRTALDANDASLVVRKQNKALLRTYMMDKPFGVGLGLSGVKAARYAPGAYPSTIPTDSWFVMIWVETGIVGLVLNIIILLYIIFYAVYQTLFKIKNNMLKGINIALLGGVSGMIAASYANEILGQIPNCVFVFSSMALLFVIPKIDKQLVETPNIND